MAYRDGIPTCKNCGNPVRNADDRAPDLCVDCRNDPKAYARPDAGPASTSTTKPKRRR